jgi:hypothetical protein
VRKQASFEELLLKIPQVALPDQVITFIQELAFGAE